MKLERMKYLTLTCFFFVLAVSRGRGWGIAKRALKAGFEMRNSLLLREIVTERESREMRTW